MSHVRAMVFAKQEIKELRAENALLKDALADVCKAAREVWEAPDKIPYAGEDERFWALVYALRLSVERAEKEEKHENA